MVSRKVSTQETMDSWRQQYQLENEDEALVKALELSRLEQQGSQRAQTQPTVEPLQTEFQRTTQALGPDLKSTLTSVFMLSMNLCTVYFQIVTLNALHFLFH